MTGKQIETLFWTTAKDTLAPPIVSVIDCDRAFELQGEYFRVVMDYGPNDYESVNATLIWRCGDASGLPLGDLLVAEKSDRTAFQSLAKRLSAEAKALRITARQSGAGALSHGGTRSP